MSNFLKFLILFSFSFSFLFSQSNYFGELVETIQKLPPSVNQTNFLIPQNIQKFNNTDLVNLLKSKQFGNSYNPEFLYSNKENNFFKKENFINNAIYTSPNSISVTTQSIKKLREPILKNDYEPCAGSNNPIQCNRELFVSCASSYEDSQIMPIQCERYSPYEYGDFINYAFQNPDNTISDYFDSKLSSGQNLLTNISYEQNQTELKDIFEDKKGEKSGWATWFGHGPNGEYDKLAGTSQYGGWTGGCGAGNRNVGCYQSRDKNTCIVSIPKSTMKEFYGISGIKDSVRNLLNTQPKIEVRNTANNKCTVEVLGDVGPGESTGKAIDLTGCVMKKLGGSGMIHAHFKPLKDGEEGCVNEDENTLPLGGIIEKIVNCNCEKTERKVVVVSDKINRKRLIGVFEYSDIKNFKGKDGDEILAKYTPASSNIKCAIRPTPKSNKCIQEVVGVSGNKYSIINIAGSLIRAGSTEKDKNQISI